MNNKSKSGKKVDGQNQIQKGGLYQQKSSIKEHTLKTKKSSKLTNLISPLKKAKETLKIKKLLIKQRTTNPEDKKKNLAWTCQSSTVQWTTSFCTLNSCKITKASCNNMTNSCSPEIVTCRPIWLWREETTLICLITLLLTLLAN